MNQHSSFGQRDDDQIGEARREALKRFGRYAAVAPTAMLLLLPRRGEARHTPAHKAPPKKKEDGDGGYQ
jgi:hypothetical protein